MKKLNEDPPMNPDDFEQRLQGQPMRPIPAQWRSEILAAAKSVSHQPSAKPHRSFAGIISQQLRSLLWPCPQVWAGLAIIWLIVFTVQFGLRQTEPVTMHLPPSREMTELLREQQLILAQLIAPSDEPIAEPPKTFKPGPRSDYPTRTVII